LYIMSLIDAFQKKVLAPHEERIRREAETEIAPGVRLAEAIVAALAGNRTLLFAVVMFLGAGAAAVDAKATDWQLLNCEESELGPVWSVAGDPESDDFALRPRSDGIAYLWDPDSNDFIQVGGVNGLLATENWTAITTIESGTAMIWDGDMGTISATSIGAMRTGSIPLTPLDGHPGSLGNLMGGNYYATTSADNDQVSSFSGLAPDPLFTHPDSDMSAVAVDPGPNNDALARNTTTGALEVIPNVSGGGGTPIDTGMQLEPQEIIPANANYGFRAAITVDPITGEICTILDHDDPFQLLTDADNDGHSPPADCNDNEEDVHPGAPDPHNDGIDNNCEAEAPEISSVQVNGSETPDPVPFGSSVGFEFEASDDATHTGNLSIRLTITAPNGDVTTVNSPNSLEATAVLTQEGTHTVSTEVIDGDGLASEPEVVNVEVEEQVEPLPAFEEAEGPCEDGDVFWANPENPADGYVECNEGVEIVGGVIQLNQLGAQVNLHGMPMQIQMQALMAGLQNIQAEPNVEAGLILGLDANLNANPTPPPMPMSADDNDDTDNKDSSSSDANPDQAAVEVNLDAGTISVEGQHDLDEERTAEEEDPTETFQWADHEVDEIDPDDPDDDDDDDIENPADDDTGEDPETCECNADGSTKANPGFLMLGLTALAAGVRRRFSSPKRDEVQSNRSTLDGLRNPRTLM
jgi:hypothetical protein